MQILPIGVSVWFSSDSAVILIFLPTASSRVDKFRPTILNLIIALALLVSSMFLFVKTSPFIYFNF